MIQTNEALAGACRAWLEQDCVGVDTEFERTRTYFARPGLVQVSVGDRVYLLDPLELSDWTPFAALLGSPRVQIVMHAGSEDIGLLWRLTGVQPVNLFDTQIAAGLSSLEANPSYQKLVKQTIGEDIDKGESRSDWLKRPLSPAQLEYAALDVKYLSALRDRLQPTLNALGRLDWVFEEGERLVENAMSDQGLRHFERTITRLDLRCDQQSLLKRLCVGREVLAAERDLPRRRLLDDDLLIGLANALSEGGDEAEALSRLAPTLSSRQQKSLQACLQRCPQTPPAPPVLGRQQIAQHDRVLKRLKSRIRDRAQALNIAPERLASKRMLESLIAHRLQREPAIPDTFNGWRERTITRELLDIIDRELDGA